MTHNNAGEPITAVAPGKPHTFDTITVMNSATSDCQKQEWGDLNL